MPKKRKNTETGATLVEVLTALGLSILLVIGAGAVFTVGNGLLMSNNQSTENRDEANLLATEATQQIAAADSVIEASSDTIAVKITGNSPESCDLVRYSLEETTSGTNTLVRKTSEPCISTENKTLEEKTQRVYEGISVAPGTQDHDQDGKPDFFLYYDNAGELLNSNPQIKEAGLIPVSRVARVELAINSSDPTNPLAAGAQIMAAAKIADSIVAPAPQAPEQLTCPTPETDTPQNITVEIGKTQTLTLASYRTNPSQPFPAAAGASYNATTGVLSVAPTTAGTYTLNLAGALDSNGCAIKSPITVTVTATNPPPPTKTCSPTPPPSVTAAQSRTLIAGSSYTTSLVGRLSGGVVPPGMFMSGSTLTGTPTVAGSYTITTIVQQFDGDGCVISEALTEYPIKIVDGSAAAAAPEWPPGEGWQTQNSVSIRWPAVADADEYDVKAVIQGTSTEIYSQRTTQTQIILGPLNANTVYQISVRACFLNGCAQQAGTVLAATNPDPNPSIQPKWNAANNMELNAGALQSEFPVELTWTPNGTTASYEIQADGKPLTFGSSPAGSTIMYNRPITSSVTAKVTLKNRLKDGSNPSLGTALSSNTVTLPANPPGSDTSQCFRSGQDRGFYQLSKFPNEENYGGTATFCWSKNAATQNTYLWNPVRSEWLNLNVYAMFLPPNIETDLNQIGWHDPRLYPDWLYDFYLRSCNETGCVDEKEVGGTGPDPSKAVITLATKTARSLTFDVTRYHGSQAISLLWCDATAQATCNPASMLATGWGEKLFTADDLSAAGNQAKITGLTPGTRYRFKIKTHNAQSGAENARVSITSSAYTFPGGNNFVTTTDAPDDPTNVRAYNTAAQFTDFTWTADTQADYSQVRINGGPNTQSTPVHRFTGLTAASTNTAEVRSCFNTGICSLWVADTFGTKPMNFSGAVTTSSINQTSATVSWPTAGGTNVTYRITTSPTTTTQTTTSTSRTLSGLTSGTNYTVFVEACNTNFMTMCNTQISAAFATTAAPITTAPTGLTQEASSTQVTEIGATWTPVSGATRYELIISGVVRNTDAGRPNIMTGLTGASQYDVTVRACNAAGCGPASTAVTMYTRPGQVNNFTVNPQQFSATANWTAPNGGGNIGSNYTLTLKDRFGNFVRSISNTSTSTSTVSQSITSLTQSTQYILEIVACNKGNAAYCNSNTATTSFTTLTPYTVTYHANDGSGRTQTQTCVGACNLLSNPWTRSGYSSSGWSTTSGGSAVYTGGSFTPTSDMSLYVVWSPVAPTIGSFSVTSTVARTIDFSWSTSGVMTETTVTLVGISGAVRTFTASPGSGRFSSTSIRSGTTYTVQLNACHLTACRPSTRTITAR